MKLIPNLTKTGSLVPVTLLCACLSLPALAQQKIEESADTSANPTVEIEHVSGKAHIKVWEKNQVHIGGTLGKKSETYHFEKHASGVRFEVETQRHRDDWKSGYDKGDDLLIRVPRGSRLLYTAVNADVEINDIANATQVDLVNGDIKVSRLQGKTKLETVNGDIVIDDVAGELMIETVNGDIEGAHANGDTGHFITVNGDIDITTQARELRMDSVNGDMEFIAAQINELDIVTVNGTVDGEINLTENGNVSASSVGGKITLAFQPEVAARFELQGHAGGNIENNLTDAQASKAKYGPTKWLEFTTGNGSARVEMSTVHGLLEINKH